MNLGLATLIEGVGLLFSKLIIRFESFNLLWCYKCVKLENEVFYEENCVSTIILKEKNVSFKCIKGLRRGPTLKK